MTIRLARSISPMRMGSNREGIGHSSGVVAAVRNGKPRQLLRIACFFVPEQSLLASIRILAGCWFRAERWESTTCRSVDRPGQPYASVLCQQTTTGLGLK